MTVDHSIIKPIETFYRGAKYRSRLEARWAVFMTTLGVEYHYEPEGYHLEGGVMYVPDFWIPQLECYLEIKPEEPSDSECEKAALLCKATGKDVYLFVGYPRALLDDWQTECGYWYSRYECEDGEGEDKYHVGWDHHHWWCQCKCGVIGIEFEGRSDRIKCRCKKDGDRGCGWDTEDLWFAFEKAKNYRFY